MPSDQQTDHVEEARRILKTVSEDNLEEVHPSELMEAQAHASIAIAEELRKFRELMGSSAT